MPFARAYLVVDGGDDGVPRATRGHPRPTFDPGDADRFAVTGASPVIRGTRR